MKKIVYLVLLISTVAFGSGFLEDKNLSYFINIKTNSCEKISDEIKRKIISDIESGHVKYKIEAYYLGEKTLMNINLDGRTIDFASYSGLGLCTMFNEMIKYGSLVHGIDYYMELDN